MSLNLDYRDQHNQIGKITGSELRNGPIINRKCTDLVCLFISILIISSSFTISIYSLRNGHPSELTVPYDTDHQPCGKGTRKNYPYIYFVEPHIHTLWRTVCVKQCPTKHDKQLKCYPNSEVETCRGTLTLTPGKTHFNRQLK